MQRPSIHNANNKRAYICPWLFVKNICSHGDDHWRTYIYALDSQRVKQLKMNKFMKHIWQLIISTSNVAVEVPSLRRSVVSSTNYAFLSYLHHFFSISFWSADKVISYCTVSFSHLFQFCWWLYQSKCNLLLIRLFIFWRV